MTIEKLPTHNEFRSDTFTVPTQDMLALAFENATFGDSVYKEDASTTQLEQYVAELAGKEAALFCVLGTLSNQIGIRSMLLQPPYSVICDYRAHIYTSEAGALATLSQAMVLPIVPANGNYITVEDIEEHFIPDDGDIHCAPTKLISLENTLHGIVTPLEEIRKIADFAAKNDIALVCDGARIWNACVATGHTLAEYCQYFDSVSICISKSLGAPMGSVLVGSKRFIDKANHFKKQSGGGIRQAGLMTSMGLYAVQNNFAKLYISHEYAQQVLKICEENEIILESPVDSSFVFIDLKANNWNDEWLIAKGNEYGIRLMGGRLAFHWQQSQESVDKLKEVLIQCKEWHKVHPYVTKKGLRKMYNVKAISAPRKIDI